MGVFMIFVALLVVYLLQFSKRLFHFLRIVKFSRQTPGPRPLELLAAIKEGKILNWLQKLRCRYGPTFCIWFGKDLTLFISDPDDVKSVLSNNQMLYKSNNYKLVEPWLGKGLLTSGGELWHRKRKLLTPAFHFKILGEFKPTMEDNSDIWINRLTEKANGEGFDIYPYVTLLALDIICETAMGIKKNAQLESTSEYVTAVQDICRISHKQSFSVWNRFSGIFNMTEMAKERKRALEILHGETLRVIALRRKALKEANISTLADAEKVDYVGAKKRLAFLDILLLSQMEGANLSDTDIREEVDTFMFEGHDTTSSAVSFAIYLFSQHPEEQRKAYEEAVEFEGREKEPMKYLEAVIKETLRLYPSVPFYSRMMTEDVQLGKRTVPSGTSLAILAYALHRDEKQFPEPDKFKPDRFLLNEKNMHPYSFVAFSAGPRNCIGQKYAMLELKCTLAKLLRNFEVLPVEGFEPQLLAQLIIKSGNGIQVRLRKR